MNQSKLFVEYDPTTPLLADILISIFSFHMFTRKDTLLKLETDAILRKQFRKKLAFDLLYELVNSVSESKVTFKGWVSM
jgi:hypothetical protein